jgi:nucleoside-diphosphate-sugar epimerase
MINAGWRVCGCARFNDHDRRAQLEKLGVSLIRFDIENGDPAKLPDVDVVVLEVWDPSMIGASGRYLETMNLNVRAVGRIVERYAGKADIINGSTVSLYGPRGDRQPRETDPPRPHDDYALSRIAQEWLVNSLCERNGKRVVHLRYCHSNTVESGFIRRTAELVRDGISLGGTPDQRVQVISLGDFVRCTVAAIIERGRMPREVNIVHPRVWTHRELAEQLQAGMKRGSVMFDVEEGGQNQSIWGDPTLMLETFGQPQDDIDQLVTDVANAVASSRKHV